MPDVIGIDHVYITVASLEISEKFYDTVLAKLLGFRKHDFVLGGERHVQYYNRHFGYVLRPVRNVGHFDSYSPGLHHICLRVDSVADVEAAALELQATGLAAPVTATHRIGCTFWRPPSGSNSSSGREAREQGSDGGRAG